KEDRDESEPPPANKLESKQRDERREQEETERWDPRIVRRIPYREGTAYLDDRYAQIYVVTITEGNEKPRRLTDVDTAHSAPQWTPDGQYILTARSAQPD